MRKLYAWFTGLAAVLLAVTSVNARAATPDVANFTFTVNVPNITVIFENTSTLGNEPGVRKAYWSFGDGITQMTPPLQGTQHHYTSGGTYTVCLKIYRYFTNSNDSVLSAQSCKTVVIETSTCQANFETLATGATLLGKYFVAIPSHSQNKKPVRVCWTFGDGKDTCIQYLTTFTGAYAVYHLYNLPGTYNVCVNILYDGGCQAQNCKAVLVEQADSCRADFEKTASSANTNPLLATFTALPWHNLNKKPVRICWTFGDNKDTCIQYSTSFTGPYSVNHTYANAGSYEVCVDILYQGGCEARKCKFISTGHADSCRADFERLPATNTNNPLTVVYKALPWHNNNKKPSRICWTFGDGKDTCISYLNIFAGQYTVPHTYANAGLYQVCVHIQYFGGCEASNCKPIQVGNPDNCHADFERIPTVAGTNPQLTYFRALPQHNNNRKPSRICWTFGDNRDTCINYPENYTGQYVVSHFYQHPGQYEVCVTIQYYGGCEARKCRTIEVTAPDTCNADFERIQSSTANPLLAYFRALPQHNNNRKPSRICWTFGDNKDTCINYPENYTGQYVVSHLYQHSGQYEVCVNILYFGGCEARKCRTIQVTVPDTCHADFERIPANTGSNPLLSNFRALPQHNNNRKPSRICWTFGDGKDTCINYPETFTGQYVVSHLYQHPGQYEVCVTILYFGGCEARKCRTIQVITPDVCNADFERIQSTTANSLLASFHALPQHNNNRKPSRICWTFGDGKDTCINYPETFTGQYIVSHLYQHSGQYEVCVNILYYGGCEARKCKIIQVTAPDTCNADFERIQSTIANPLLASFRALPQHNNNRKPSRICWTFGDGKDTCINYPETFTGQYVVSHLYQHPGQYEVCVNILYFGGCEARKCHQVIVQGPQQTCTVSLFEITPSITSLIRGFYAIATSNPTARPERICWYFGDGTDSCITFNPSLPVPALLMQHTYPGPGEYHACVKVWFQGGCIAENCRQVVIQSGPNVLCGGFITDSMIGPRSYKFKGFSIHAPNDNVLNYRWTFGDGITAFGQEVTHTFVQGGNYQVCLTITTQLGCETKICKTLAVSGSNVPVLQLSPIPVINEIHVNFISTHTEQVTIRILNSMGLAVRNYTRNVTIGVNTWTHDLSTLLPGIYSYILQSPNQLASTIFLKQ